MERLSKRFLKSVLSVTAGIEIGVSTLFNPASSLAQEKQFLVLCMREDQPIPHEFINPNTVVIAGEEYPYRGGFAVVIGNSKGQSWVDYYRIIRANSSREITEQLNEQTRRLVNVGGTIFHPGALSLTSQRLFNDPRFLFLDTTPYVCSDSLYEFI